MRKIDLTGQKFGKLTVIERAKNDGRFTTWKCLCDCGKYTIVRTNNLKMGKTKTCGCSKKTAKHKTHGQSETRLYSIWEHMRARCGNPNNRDFCNYGGRGISVCEEWENNFEAFAKWANFNGYKETLTIERINVNGNYEPDNCKWATKKEQGNNTRRNVYVSFGDDKLTIAQLSERVNIPYMRLYKRICIRGIDVKSAVLMG